MGRRKRQDKEGMAEECCFSCKDGSNDLRVCDFKNCLKAYHPACVGKGDAFLSSDEPFICDWHMCINCRGSSDYQCLCCPLYSVCCACLEKLEFVQLRKQKKGFCSMCLNRAILIEKNADADLAKTDHGDAEIGDILFKDYWEVIKDREHLALVDLEEASVFLNRKFNCEGVNSAKFSGADHNSDENILADNDANDQTITFDSKRKQDKVNTSLKNNKSNKKTYAGWASEELIAFLSSFGKDTTKPVDELEIVGLVKGYIKQKNLYRDNKKLSFLCDDKLQPLFTRRKVRCKMIRRFLSVHLASNAVSEDEISYGSEDDDVPVIVKKPRNDLQPKIAKRVSERSKICFASLIQKNINLIYLRRTLVVSLLSHPDTFEQKVVGCFVRLKNPLTVHTYQICTEAFQVGLVTGIKKSSEEYKINDTYTNVLLCVSGLWDDIQISMLSDEDFQEDECNGIISLVKKGLLKRATIAEFEEKVATVHADIVNHWFESELVRLEKNIDRAQIKGWRVELEELLRQKKLLSTPAERQRRLEELPEIVPDTEYEEKETELEVAANNSSQEKKGAAQQVAISLKDLAEEPPKGAGADAVDCLKVLTEKRPEGERDQLTDSLNILNEESSEGATDQGVDPLNGLNGEPSKGATEQIPDSSNLLNKESSEAASKQGDATCEAPPKAHEACFSGGAPDPGLHSQMHSTQDDSPTQAMDIDRNGSDHSQQDNLTKFNEVEVINLDSDDEDPPTVQHKPAGKSMHAPKAGGILGAEQSESALPSPATMNIHLEQHKPTPATMNGVLEPELRRPAPATMNGLLPPEQHEPAPAATNGVLHPAQCKPASAANNRVSPQAPLWHYVDPQGDTRGPFALVQLCLWKQKGFFREDFRVWRTGQTAEQAILLTDVFRMHI